MKRPNVGDRFFGTLWVPSKSEELARELCVLRGWRIATFSAAKGGFEVQVGDWTEFIDFVKAPIPFHGVVALIFTEDSAALAFAFEESAGTILPKYKASDLAIADLRDWLDGLVIERVGTMLEDVADSRSVLAVMQERVTELHASNAELTAYLHNRVAVPLHKAWHSAYRDGETIDLSGPYAVRLPRVESGLVRLQLWVVQSISGVSLNVELQSANKVYKAWSIDPEHIGRACGWISLDLDRASSHQDEDFVLSIMADGWRLGGSTPSKARGDVAEAPATLALRLYTTLPGLTAPVGSSFPVDDRQQFWLLEGEFASARPLSVPPDLPFSPVGQTDKGLLVHPVADAPMVAAIEDGCPAFASLARLFVVHDNPVGEPFLVTLQAERSVDESFDEGPTPLPAGRWFKVDGGAHVEITFAIDPLPQTRPLYIVTKTVPGRLPHLAWAIVTAVQFVIADQGRDGCDVLLRDDSIMPIGRALRREEDLS